MNDIQAQKREFANLLRYQEANSKLNSPAKNEKRVVFMGNSITDSWTESFFENKPYFNRGISGQTTPQMLIRFRQDVIDLEPKVVVILCSVLPATIFPWAKEVLNPADKIIELNMRLKKYAKKNGHTYLDYYSSMANEEKGLKEKYAADAVHPNKEGYTVMIELVEEAIFGALN